MFPGYVQTPLLDEINGMMGADMSRGRALTAWLPPRHRDGHRPKTILHLFALGDRLQRSYEPADAAASVRSGHEPNVQPIFHFPACRRRREVRNETSGEPSLG